MTVSSMATSNPAAHSASRSYMLAFPSVEMPITRSDDHKRYSRQLPAATTTTVTTWVSRE